MPSALLMQTSRLGVERSPHHGACRQGHMMATLGNTVATQYGSALSRLPLHA